MICPKCKHDWEYTGQMTVYVNCPNCRTAIKKQQVQEQEAQ